MIAYPAELPVALRENYGFEQTNNIARTQMASGRARQRIEFRNAPTMVQLAWICSSAQASIFEYWASQVVGAGWFTIPLKTPLGLDPAEVRFTEVPAGPALIGADHWKFTAACELRKRPLLPPGWVEFLPGFVAHSDIFDLAINREWPKP
jgi:hypothetical protein